MENLTIRDPCPERTALKEPPPEIAATLSVLGGKWKILILWQLFGRSCRFNELRRAIDGVSQHMLTVHLRELEHEGILTRTIFAEAPPRVENALPRKVARLGHEDTRRVGTTASRSTTGERIGRSISRFLLDLARRQPNRPVGRLPQWRCVIGKPIEACIAAAAKQPPCFQETGRHLLGLTIRSRFVTSDISVVA
jgi:DNA-binding HxlR family transcriptional regulator